MRKILMAAILAAVPARAALPESRNDFAFGHAMEFEAGKSFVQVAAPDELYRAVKKPGLEDVAVFNAKDELVPHAIGMPPAGKTEAFRELVPLTIFTVYAPKAGEAPFAKVRASTTADGAIVELRVGNAPAPKGKKIAGYLVDASKVERALERLRVRLDGTGDFYGRLTLEGSQDLEKWDRISDDAALARFQLGAQELTKDELKLPGERHRYYRITFNNPSEQATIGSVEGVYLRESEKVLPPMRWTSVAVQALPAAPNGAAYAFDTGGLFPVEELKVSFPEPNSFARLSFEGTNDPAGSWISVVTGTFYSVTKEGKPLTEDQVSFPVGRFRHWRVRLMSSPGGVGKSLPAISFGWRAELVQFLARGAAPFTLAYGSAEAAAPSQADVLRDAGWTGTGAPATLKERVVLGGDAKLVAIPKTDAMAWKKALLAAVLIGGVVLLGGMALQVKKEIPKA